MNKEEYIHNRIQNFVKDIHKACSQDHRYKLIACGDRNKEEIAVCGCGHEEFYRYQYYQLICSKCFTEYVATYECSMIIQ